MTALHCTTEMYLLVSGESVLGMGKNKASYETQSITKVEGYFHHAWSVLARLVRICGIFASS